MTNAFINNYFPSEKTAKIFPFKFNFIRYFERLINEFSQIFFPTNSIVSLIVFIIITVFILVKIFHKKQNSIWLFLAVWIFSTIPIFLINSRMSQSHAAFIGVSGGIILSFAYLVDKLFEKKKIFVILLIGIPIFFSNLYAAFVR